MVDTSAATPPSPAVDTAAGAVVEESRAWLDDRAMKNSCTCQLQRIGDFTDRLSNLPDFLLYHILSFLETQYAVQTSVLSRRWRSVWKHLPTLTLYAESFNEFSQFQILVDKVLSLRYQVNVDEINYEDEQPPSETDLYDRIIDYAFSHHTQHLWIALDGIVTFSELFGSNVNCKLKTLELSRVCFDVGACCFEMLTTLWLTNCILAHEQDYDLSLSLPRLMNLDIYNLSCEHRTRVKFYAPQLLNLKLRSYDGLDIEIAAPKLKFFSLEFVYVIPKFSLPYVDHAEILVKNVYEAPMESLAPWLNLSFSGLHGAKSLVLRCYTTEVLKEICNFVEQKPFCFTKLESLVCVLDKPYQVVNYQVEGYSSGEPNAKNFRRQH